MMYCAPFTKEVVKQMGYNSECGPDVMFFNSHENKIAELITTGCENNEFINFLCERYPKTFSHYAIKYKSLSLFKKCMKNIPENMYEYKAIECIGFGFIESIDYINTVCDIKKVFGIWVYNKINLSLYISDGEEAYISELLDTGILKHNHKINTPVGNIKNVTDAIFYMATNETLDPIYKDNPIQNIVNTLIQLGADTSKYEDYFESIMNTTDFEMLQKYKNII